MHHLLSAAILATACLAACCETGSASPVGLWLAKDGGKIRISPCGRNLCGFLVQPVPTNDPATGHPTTDKNNSDPAKRNRPLAGVEILISMHREGQSKWAGHVYNADDGKVYQGNLNEKDQSNIRIEGCWLGICDGENLTRIK
jgi:uncharacterized protein (DUF2147 family)